MGQSLIVFTARIEDLRRDILFVKSAAEFRPHLYRVLNRDAEPAAVVLAERFADIRDSQVSAIYGPLMVRLAASIERYLRGLIEECVVEWGKKASSAELVPQTLRDKNVVLSGRLLASSDQPRDHIRLDVAKLITNLASCSGSRRDFVLNTQAFSVLVTGITPETIETVLKAVKVGDCWDAACADPNLKQVLRLTRTSDASKETRKRLKEFSRWRNDWAHGGDEEITLTDEELLNACEFASHFARSLDKVVSTRIQNAKLDN